MNHDEVIVALECVLNRDAEAYKEAVKKTAGLPTDSAEFMLYSYLSGPLEEILARQEEYRAQPNVMFMVGRYSASGFSPPAAARQLLQHAFHVGPRRAADWLVNVLSTKSAEGSLIMLLHGIETERRTTIADGVELIPFDEVPASSEKAYVVDAEYGWLPDSIKRNTPTAALFAKGVVEQFLIEAGTIPRTPCLDELEDQLDEIRLCLSIFGPCAPVEAIQWFQYSDPDLVTAVSGEGFSWHMPEAELTSFDVNDHPVNVDAIMDPVLIRRYLGLSGEIRDKLRISMERLIQAIRRISIGDKAIELAIALEVLLTDQQGENTWKIGFRGAQLAGGTVDERLRHRGTIAALYRLRSSTMHHGVAGETVKVPGQGERQSLDVFNNAAAICAAVIRMIISRGQIPDWPRFEIEGIAEK